MEAGEAGDQLLDDDRLADACTAKEAGLAAAHQRAEQVDDLDAGLEQLGLRGELVELRRLVVDRPPLGGGRRPEAVDGLADQVEHPSQGLDADGHRDRRTRVEDVDAALQTVRRAQSDGAHAAAAEMLGDLAPQGLDAGLAEHRMRHFDAQGVVDAWELILGEMGVQCGADDLGYLADIAVCHGISNLFEGAQDFARTTRLRRSRCPGAPW